MNEYPSHKHTAGSWMLRQAGKPAATRRPGGRATGLRFLSGSLALRAALWLFLFSASLRAFGTERNGSTFTPGSLGDFGMAVVSTNAGLYLRNDTIYYRGSDSRTVGAGQFKMNLDLVAWADSVKLIWVPGVKVFGAQYAGAVNLALINAQDRFQGDYFYACLGLRF